MMSSAFTVVIKLQRAEIIRMKTDVTDTWNKIMLPDLMMSLNFKELE